MPQAVPESYRDAVRVVVVDACPPRSCSTGSIARPDEIERRQAPRSSVACPGLRGLRGRALRAALDGYLDLIAEREFRAHLGDRFAGGVILSTGTEAYRDEDGIAIVPLALLGA